MHRTSAQLTITTSQAQLKLGQKNYFWDLKKNLQEYSQRVSHHLQPNDLEWRACYYSRSFPPCQIPIPDWNELIPISNSHPLPSTLHPLTPARTSCLQAQPSGKGQDELLTPMAANSQRLCSHSKGAAMPPGPMPSPPVFRWASVSIHSECCSHSKTQLSVPPKILAMTSGHPALFLRDLLPNPSTYGSEN